MQTYSWLLLSTLSLLGPDVVLTKDGNCSCQGLINVKNLIPKDARQARELLYKYWKFTRKDVCRFTFQSIPISTLLGEQGTDMKLGPFVKLQAEELNDYLWKSWVQSHDQLQGRKLKDVDWINFTNWSSPVGLDREFNDGIKVLNRSSQNTESMISQLREFVPNLNFTELLDSEDVKAAMKDLACSWATHSHRVSAFYVPLETGFEKIMKTEGIENLDTEYVRKPALALR